MSEASFNGEEALVNFNREGIKIGTINGAVALLLMFGSYYLGFDIFYRVYMVSRFIPYMLVLIIIHGFTLRRKGGGYLSFKEGLRYAFMAYLISEILVAIGSYILFAVVDPQLTRAIAEENVARNPEALKIMNISKEEYLDQNSTTGIRNILVGMGQYLLFDFILSALASLIIRREKPVF
jgi:hypothetical protein